MMRRILLLLTVVALMVGMSVLPASAEPPPLQEGAGPIFMCFNPDTGVETGVFARSLAYYRTLGFTDCSLYPLWEPSS